MTPQKRSTLQLDLKNLNHSPASPKVGPIGVVVVTAVALVSTIISIDSPSASNIRHEQLVTATSENPGNTETTSQLDPFDQYVISNAGLHTTSASAPIQTTEDHINSDSDRNLVSIKAGASKTDGLKDKNAERLQLAMLAPDLRHYSTGQNNNPAPILTESDLDPVAAIEPIERTVRPALVPIEIEDQNELSSANQPVLASAESVEQWFSAKVKKKDTLSQIFNRLGLSSKEAYAIVKYKAAKQLKRIRPGEKIEITRSANNGSNTYKLDKLRFKLDTFETLIVTRDDNDYQFESEIREPTVQHRTASAEIKNSLLGSAQSADVPYEIVYNLATIFGWQIDFAKDIQPGDQFSVVYEELYLDQEKVGEGHVVAAQLQSSGKIFRAVRHIDEDNRISYYAPDGDGIQGSFLRTPIKFARVTSKFSNNRFNPVLKKWKAHKGVDYGAPMKTPILATGDGVVKYAGKKSGYGRTIILRHGEKYQTLYAHMNHFKKGLKSGSRVKQGDVIGYVGKTGWTTGPHLHYEFRVNGAHMNPLTVELPKSASIPKKYRQQFKQDANQWISHFEEVMQFAERDKKQSPLALNDY